MASIWGQLSVVNPIYKYKWELHDFRPEKVIVGEALRSVVFTVTNVDTKFYWQIILYPKGLRQTDCSTIALLNRHGSQTFRANVTFSLVNGKGSVIHSSAIPTKTFRPNKTNGTRFFPQSWLTNKKLLGFGGKLTILCEVHVIAKNSEEEDGEEEEEMEEEETTSAPEKVNEDDQTLQRLREFDEFEYLVNEKTFSDVVFIVSGIKVFAHKCILATRSPVFAAMFTHDMRETNENKVVVEDIESDVFLELLRFVYTGKINLLNKEMTSDLLMAADKYSVDGLKSLAEKKLYEEITESCALDWLLLADRCHAKELRQKTMEFIADHANVIVKSVQFKFLPYSLIVEICGALANKIK